MSQQDKPAATISPEVTKETKAKRLSTDSDSDEENQQDAFEDAAVDVAEVAEVAEVRSLTQRTPSVSKPPPTEETDPEHPKKEEIEDEEEAAAPSSPAKETNHFVDEEFKSDDDDSEIKRKASPVSHRLSNTSNLDDIKLDDDHPAPQESDSKSISTVEEKAPPKKMSISSITGALPSMPWSPPAEPSLAKSSLVPATAPPQTAPSATLPPPPGPPTRKLTSPFSWLSRNSTSKEKETSPPPQASPRRNTASSIATLTSNSEIMLGRLDEEKEGAGTGGVPRHSLKDRFKMVRLREEAGITLPSDDDKPVPPPKGLGLSTPPAQIGNDKELGADQAPKSPLPTTPNLALAPGTVSGVSAGPSDMSAAQVDWDLWQSVVYEGPAVVARTSSEELNRAIASGIPNAIRGVIWQVLAQSNNEELEIMYRELVARGTDKEVNRNSQSTVSSGSNGTLSIHNDVVNSSASSVHSEHSGANGMPSPHEKSAEAVLKAQQAATVARQKKQKEDTAMLQKLDKTIRRDLGARTSFSKYAAAAGLQEGLFGVCKAYALFDEAVGYAQGMNFLIMPLLFNMSEEEAFCLLVRLMNHYHLRDLFIQDMPGLHKNLYIFERLLEDFEPALYCHLRRRSISPHLYATQWFLTLFAYRFPLQLVLRIYDLILSEGLSAILRFGIVLMQKNVANLLAISDMQQLTVFLKDKLFDAYIDTAPSAGSILENGFFGSSSSSMDKEVYRADQFVRDACDVKITPEILKVYTLEWEEKTRVEKEREAELEQLRSANINFAVKVRKLEERVEAYDSEQAALATELVHTKVENEELKDENESLKGQVRELRNVIQKQPEELENAWKAERDDLMKRNQKVHEENEKLEKEMAELEEELVQTKMQYAEINSQHETLTRKWTDLKRQFA
ncbi:GTPase-activating protein GYP5 [Colletotrichum tanaceti]|uniref:GTPase-activating protein GYP5 n=1 Tax=Colletotrichum tanaceti TaxID=1306861 RepID=A0A4U6XM43_9PEZI|nr:GTPase-activating protein GYP5 [Colletotrichum tanaceti]KAJ0168505.1 GTPase-activating protein GYP5 [Colletotrichum tanaceti]TKW56722.1 GTPase-activating protein GYP5 [Colletotrichum tanaceti]